MNQAQLVYILEELNAMKADLAAVAVSRNINQVSSYLSGHPVTVIFDVPALAGARGFVFREGDRAIIQVSPDLDDVDRLRTLLHEVAHARLHWEVIDGNSKLWRGGALRWTNKQAHDAAWNARKKEDDAERLAGDWYRFALDRAGSDATFEDWITTLMTWKE